MCEHRVIATVSIWHIHIPVNRKASTDNEQYIHHKPLRLNLTVILNTSSCSRGMASRDQKLLAPNTCTGIRRPSDLSSFDLESVLLVHAAYPLVHFPRCDTSQFISPTTGRLSYQQHSDKTNTHLPPVASAISYLPIMQLAVRTN